MLGTGLFVEGFLLIAGQQDLLHLPLGVDPQHHISGAFVQKGELGDADLQAARHLAEVCITHLHPRSLVHRSVLLLLPGGHVGQRGWAEMPQQIEGIPGLLVGDEIVANNRSVAELCWRERR